MKIKLTLREVNNLVGELHQLSANELTLEARRDMRKFSKVLDETFNEIEEMRVELIKELGSEGEDKVIRVSDEKQSEFFEKWNEFLGKEEEFDLPKLNFKYYKHLSTKVDLPILLDKIFD